MRVSWIVFRVICLIAVSGLAACQSSQRGLASQKKRQISSLVSQDFCLELVDSKGRVEKAYVSPSTPLDLKANLQKVRIGTMAERRMTYLEYPAAKLPADTKLAFDRKKNSWVLVRPLKGKRYKSLSSQRGRVVPQGQQLERHPCNVN